MSKQTEYCGSTKFMPEDLLKAKLAKARQNVEELTAEQKRRESFTPEMKLCDRLHHLIHFAADCDYYYSDWPSPKGCRSEHLQLTFQLIRTLGIDLGSGSEPHRLDALLALMERQRFGTVNA